MTIIMNYIYIGVLTPLIFLGITRTKEDTLKAYLLGFLGFALPFVLKNTTSHLTPIKLMILSYSILYMNVLLSKKSVAIQYILPIGFSLLVYVPDVDLPNILFIIPIILFIFAFIQTNNSDRDELNPKIIKTLLSVSMIGFISSVGFLYTQLDFSIQFTLLAIIFSIYYANMSITEEYNNERLKLTERLDVLENDFTREVRKEANTRTFYLREAQERMNEKNSIDSLTKAFNKRFILKTIDDLIAVHKPFSLIMFDLDNFKIINDTSGHLEGDACLKQLVNIAKLTIRSSDYIGRFGGDEFIIVLPNSNLKAAAIVGEKIRKAVKDGTNFTISVGICSYPADGKTKEELIEIADSGLYFSKNNGRNKVSYNNPELDINF